jgi:salicylate hydroxylase
VAISAGRRDAAAVVIAADGLGSTLRRHVSDDEPVDSGFVAYRGTVPIADLSDTALLSLDEMVVYIGPSCHLVQYALRGGAMLNQVAVFRTTDGNDLDSAFSFGGEEVRAALPRFWRDRRWAMFDWEPIPNWVDGRLALVGDAAHPMLQYLAQGACQAIEDASCLGDLAALTPDWDVILAGYNAQRTLRTAQVQRVARQWGALWHCDGLFRAVRNAYLRDRDQKDYRYVDWLYAAGVENSTF